MDTKKTIAKFQQERNKFQQKSAKYHEFLLSSVKEIIRKLSPKDESPKIDINIIARQGQCEIIGKFFCPDDVTSNFFLSLFRLNAKGQLEIDAQDLEDEDGEYTFFEDELDIQDLESILETLADILDKIEKKEVFVSPEGRLFSLDSIYEIIDEHLYNEYTCEDGRFYTLSVMGLRQKEIQIQNLLHEVYPYVDNE